MANKTPNKEDSRNPRQMEKAHDSKADRQAVDRASGGETRNIYDAIQREAGKRKNP